jgi:periodic tryptophan protein 1
MKRIPLAHDPTPVDVADARARALAGADDSSDDEPLCSPREPAFASLAGVQLPAEIAAMAAEVEADAKMAAAGGGKGANQGVGAEDDDEDEEDEEDLEDMEAGPRDAFIVVANTTDDFSNLEIYVYNEDDGNMYVRHDVTLPSFPLSLAWLDYAGDASTSGLLRAGGSAPLGESYVGSFCAVGTFDPSIEVWNLDVVDPLEPTLVLSGAKKSKKKSLGKGATSSDGAGTQAGHSGAVMGLSWNRTHRHLLASGSADATAKIWDIDAGGKVLHTYTHHKNKVQAVAWNPSEHSVIAMASYDHTMSVTDARVPDAHRIARYALTADPESLMWHPHAPAIILASQQDGNVVAYDCRSPDTPLWTLKAHGSAVTSIAASSLASGLFATASLDKTVRLWDLGSAGTSTPVLLSSKALAIGQVFSVSFFPDQPHLLAAGGSAGVLALWDTAEDAGDVTAECIDAESALGIEGSTIAKYFHGRRVLPDAVPSFGIRPRSDGQPIA